MGMWVVSLNPTLVRVFLCPFVRLTPILQLIPDGIIGCAVVLGLIQNHYGHKVSKLLTLLHKEESSSA